MIKGYILGDMQVNCYIYSTDESCFVVDPGSDGEKICHEIEELNLPLEYILLTHGHFDHIGALECVKNRFPEAKVCIGQADNDKLGDPRKNLSIKFGVYNPDRVLHLGDADIFLNDGDELKFGKTKISVIGCPGHSIGGVSYVVADNIFSGDTLFCMTAGRSDFEDGDENALMNSLRRLYSLPKKFGYENMNVYPGHGEPTDIEFEKRHNIFVREK